MRPIAGFADMTPVGFKPKNFKRYLTTAPLALALERSWECEILSQKEFTRPVLDIGCGEGIFAYNLFSEKIDVGIDPDARELKRAGAYDMYHEIIQDYGDHIPKTDASFKTIFSNSVMEHIPDIEAALREAHRLLDDEGVIYLTLPTDQFDQYTIISQLLNAVGATKVKKYYHRLFNNFWAHYHCYDSPGWRAMFERNGLKVVETWEYGSRGQCMFNDLASPFSILPFLTKRLVNRWFLSSSIRQFIGASILNALFKPLASLKRQEQGKGGLVFFALQKNR